MKKFEVGELVKNKAYGIGTVVDDKNEHWIIVEFTKKKIITTTFLKQTGFYTWDSKPDSPYNIKHLSKLEKYLYEEI